MSVNTQWLHSPGPPPEPYSAGMDATGAQPAGPYATQQFTMPVPPPPAMPPVVPAAPPRREPGGRHRALRHRDVSGGWLRPAVFGAMDGLVTNASLIAGVGGGGAADHTILLTGLAGLIAGAFSMATGEYISVSSQNELTQAEVAVEQLQHSRNPEAEQRELAEVFVKRGVDPHLADVVVRQISADPEQAIAVHVREELGIDPDDLPSPWTAAGASFASFTVGALIPLLPYFLGLPSFVLALVLAGLAAFLGGGAVARLTGRPMLVGGVRQFALGALATGMTFLVGHLVGAHLS
ncbi:VIT1/CCC1 transporter family protein [Streptomyces sp. RB6PN23]|uniref:VIT1/CCC1 transporter family protein n=2 Tax=Streptomyces TaxID=1883 RepID=A0ABT5ZIG8_9ACTN|nr:VIT1/CCC1 transporter family protein [Streptomyces silvisoli]MDF3289617.1 VIT1/CCC1 transporter family protein [Streptomyces silvisoli]